MSQQKIMSEKYPPTKEQNNMTMQLTNCSDKRRIPK